MSALVPPRMFSKTQAIKSIYRPLSSEIRTVSQLLKVYNVHQQVHKPASEYYVGQQLY